MDISNLFSLFCGIALFMFGMSLMGDGLKRVAGNRLELLLAKLTSTPIRGILLGTGVTAIIQSSSATSVMTVGFVNSGMMKFRQSIGIILGSILGTSITGWVIAMSEIQGSGSWTALFSTTTITGVIAFVGILFRTFSKRYTNVGSIMLGFVVLMVGINTMSASVAPLSESQAFVGILTMFANPVFGILAGVLFACVLQSASAAVGILQALTATGAIDFATALPILLGISIGAAFPVLLSALAAGTEGKRTAFVYLLASVLGVVICDSVFYLLNLVFSFPFMGRTMNAFSIAMVNTLFRLANVVVLCPFIGLVDKLTCFIIKDKPQAATQKIEPIPLEERFLPYPPLAISETRNAIYDMAQAAEKSVQIGFDLLNQYSEEQMDQVTQYEALADQYENRIGTYLMRLSRGELKKEENADVFKYMHTLSDFERITDYAMNIAYIAKRDENEKIVFSDEANKALDVIKSAVTELLNRTVKAFIQDEQHVEADIAVLNVVIHKLCNQAELQHVERLQSGTCTLQQGTRFSELLNHMEQISTRCAKIIKSVMEVHADSYQMHAENSQELDLKSSKYKKVLDDYKQKYEI